MPTAQLLCTETRIESNPRAFVGLDTLLLKKYSKTHFLENISSVLINIGYIKAQRLINLEIPVLVRSLKSSNVELG